MLPSAVKLRVVAALLLLALSAAKGVILYRSGDPAENTTAPTGELADSGWQHEGIWGGFLGTPIAPSFFVSAAHVGQQSAVLNFHGVDYPVVRGYSLRLGPGPNGNPVYSDLIIWQIQGQFPSFAPLYSKQDETGKHLITIGRGTERGGEISHTYAGETTARGWGWKDPAGAQRWGENIVSSIVAMNRHNDDGIYALFDKNGLPHEAHLSNGDSGGAVFIQDEGVWKLAGINYAVDDLYPGPSSAGAFTAAIYDARGYYTKTGPATFELIEGTAPVPTGFYATRISARLDWIYGVVDPTGDLDSDGIPHLLEHGLKLDPLVPDAAGRPTVSREGDFLALTYRKNLAQGDLVYAVEKSEDLAVWQTAETQDEVVPGGADLELVKAKVATGNAQRLFLRLRVTRP